MMLKALMVAATGLVFSTVAAAQELVEGQHYERLETPVETVVAEGQIEVTEAFWFGCQYCYRLQSSVTDWYDTLEDDVSVVKMPATMGGDWNTHATAFYAAEQLGIEADLHNDFFVAIHEDGQAMTDADDLAAFFANYGVTEDEAREALTSFGVRSDVNRANGRMRDMQLMSVPALIIDGQYLVSPSSAGSLANMPKIADTLIARIREERAE